MRICSAAKKNPGKFHYGSPGKGTWHNFKWEIIKHQAGIDITAVPYQGNAPILAALLGGHIDIILIEKPTAFSHLKGGTVKALAISAKDDDFPDLKTFAEQGITGDFDNWKALFIRKGVPADRMKVLEDLIARGVETYDFLGEMSEHKKRWHTRERTGSHLMIGARKPKSAFLFRNGVWPTGRYLRHAEEGMFRGGRGDA